MFPPTTGTAAATRRVTVTPQAPEEEYVAGESDPEPTQSHQNLREIRKILVPTSALKSNSHPPAPQVKPSSQLSQFSGFSGTFSGTKLENPAQPEKSRIF